MRKLVLLAALAVGLAGCATTRPMQVVTALDDRDPRFNSEACRQAREAAMRYNDHTLSRAGFGLAAGLLLGPFGLIPSVAIDMSQANARNDLNAEIRRRCQTLPGEEAPAPAVTPAPSPESGG